MAHLRPLFLARLGPDKLCEVRPWARCAALSYEAAYQAAEELSAVVGGDAVVVVTTADVADCPRCASDAYGRPIGPRERRAR